MKLLATALSFVLASAPLLAFAQERPSSPHEDVGPLPPPDQPAPQPEQPAPIAEPPAAAPPQPLPWSAPPPPPRYEAPPSRIEGLPRYDFIRVGLGPRVTYVRSDGFDLFANSDTLAAFAIDASMTFARYRDFTFAAGLAYDVGGRSDGVRGIDSSLTAHRFTVPIEGRWHFRPWLYGFAKVAPGAAMLRAKFDDKANFELSDTAWAFATDLSAGASLLLFPHSDMDKRAARVWLTPEIGYSFVTSATLRPDPGRASSDVLGTDASSRLGDVGLSGLFWRVTAALTF